MPAMGFRDYRFRVEVRSEASIAFGFMGCGFTCGLQASGKSLAPSSRALNIFNDLNRPASVIPRILEG